MGDRYRGSRGGSGDRDSSKEIYIGGLRDDTSPRELEDVFSKYGHVTRCDIKHGNGGVAYAFVGYEDKRDAEEALRKENGRDMNGQRMSVAWARGAGERRSDNRCDYCGRPGHFQRDCRDRMRDQDRRGGGGGGGYGGGGRGYGSGGGGGGGGYGGGRNDYRPRGRSRTPPPRRPRDSRSRSRS